jgi:hypothetical protein
MSRIYGLKAAFIYNDMEETGEVLPFSEAVVWTNILQEMEAHVETNTPFRRAKALSSQSQEKTSRSSLCFTKCLAKV